MKIFQKLLIYFLPIAIIPLIIVVSINYASSYYYIRNALETHLSSINQLKISSFDRFVKTNTYLLESLCQRPLVIDNLQIMLSDQVADEKYIDAKNNLIYVHLNTNVVETGGIDTFSVLHPETGQIIASSNSQLIGKFRENENYFIYGKESTYIDEITYLVNEKRIVLHISSPIISPFGQLVGVLVGHVNLGELTDIIQKDTNSFSSQETYLVNQANLFITLPKHTDNLNYQVPVFTEGIDNCLEGQTGVKEYENYLGIPVIGSYEWVPDWQLCILTEVEQSVAMQPTEQLKNIYFVLLFLIIFIIFGLVVLFSKDFVRPIQKLNQGAKIIGLGNLDHRINLTASTEFIELSQSFNQMADNLQLEQHQNDLMLKELLHARINLENRVDERTKELKAAQEDTMKMVEDLRISRNIAFENEISFRTIFEDSPIALLEKDASKLKKLIDQLKDEKQVSAEEILMNYREEVENHINLIKLKHVNQAAIKLYEAKDEKEFIQKHSKTAIDFEIMLKEEIIPILNGKTFIRFEGPKKTFRGNNIWTITNISIPQGSEQTLEKILISIQDITPIKNVQNQLKEKAFELEKSNQELESFAYVASHDLQEPLRMVASYLQLIQKRYFNLLDKDGQEFIEYAIDGAKRMKKLINDLLQFSRIETRGQNFTDIDLNTVVNEVKLNLKDQIEKQEATIEATNLPHVFADYGQMVQLFQNIIGNGIKFHRDEKPVIKISYQNLNYNKNEKQQYEFTIEDNGIGISQEYFERIFVIFQRLHSQSEIEGTGIGLAIAKRIIERHSGKIWVESEPGNGSKFKFTLPSGK